MRKSNFIVTNDGIYDANRLMHWRYVKRWWKNGKWNYEYDDDSNSPSKGKVKVTSSSTRGKYQYVDPKLNSSTSTQQKNNPYNLKDVYTYNDGGRDYVKIGGDDEYGQYKSRGTDWVLNLEKGSNWFTSSSTTRYYDPKTRGYTSGETTIKVGKIAQAIKKAADWLSKLFD